MNDWLCQLLDVNFSLICEDDSCYEVARLLVEMERIVKKRDQTRMEEFVARLPKVKNIQSAVQGPSYWSWEI